MSVEDWIEFGYIELLKDHFFLIAVEPFNYQVNKGCTIQSLTLEAASLYIKDLLNELGIVRVIAWGYSLGAKAALGLYRSCPSVVQGLVLGGFELNSKVDLSNDLVINTLEKGGDAWLNLWRSMFFVPEQMSDRLRNSDTKALIELRKAEADWPDLTQTARACEVLSFNYAGERCFYRKQTEQASREFPKGYFFEISGLNHFEVMAAPEAICSRVIAEYAQL